ncbi:MAG: hypothetical protein ACJARX_001542 [Psychroserpens sp.]|jgi:hypothetical protein
MTLSKGKIDESDSKRICVYAQKLDLKLWKGSAKNEIECLQITRALSIYTKQITMLKTNYAVNLL